MRFGYPEHLIWLWALIPLALLFIYGLWARFAALKKIGNLTTLSRLAASRSPAKLIWKAIFTWIAMASLLVAFAAPQIGTRLKEVKKKGIDIVIALDVSNSMLAEDIKPNRLQKAKYEISRLIDKLGQDRIGLVVFAGEAFLQCPLTTDKSTLKLFLDVVSTDAIQLQGTNFYAAISESVRAFQGIEVGASASERNQSRNRVVLLFSDGEDFEGNLNQALEQAQTERIRIYCVGIGSDQPTPIPIYNAQGQRIDFKRSKDGIVTTTFVPEHLRLLADKTNGNFYRIDAQTTGLEPLISELNTLKKEELASREFVDYDDRFQVFIIIALLLLVLEFLNGERRSVRTKEVKS
jgi:Ca-activated chloride channel family protein